MKQLLISVILFFTIGCAGIGLRATSNPDVKIQQAYRMMDEDRALMAEDLIHQAMDIYNKNNNKFGMAEAYHAYGNLYISHSYHNKWATTFKKLGTYDGSYMKSIQNFEGSMKLFNEVSSEIGVVKSLIGIANAYHQRNEDNKACVYYKKVLSRYQEGKENGTITEEPVIFDKRFKDMGQIINSYIKHYNCST
jgi:hypothetical protein